MNTDARATALRYYRTAGRDPHADLRALARNPQGVFLFSPTLVVLMKPVLRHRPQDWENLEESPAGADAWYVHLLAGSLRQAQELAKLLPARRWLCFQRGRRSTRLHVLPWRRVCR